MSEEHLISQEQFERIEAYLLNKLSSAEKDAFEIELNDNEKLRKELQIQQEMMMAVELGSFKDTLSKIHIANETHITGGAENSPNRYWMAIAASLVTLLAVSLWIFNKPDKNEQLFAQFVQYDPGLPVPMSAQNTSNENFKYRFSDAMVDFKNEQYQLAISKWSELLDVKPNNDTLTYYIGSAHFNNAAYKSAESYFGNVAQINSSVFQNKSQFYLVLCWLQAKEYDKIKNLDFDAESAFGPEIEAIKKELKNQ